MNKIFSIAIFIFLIVLFSRVLIADSPITYPLWELVAQADLIIVGVPHVPLEEIQDGIQGNTSHYIFFEVIPQETLKGKTKKQSLEIIYWPLKDNHRPSPLLLRDLDGKEAILFLDEVDDNDSQRLYFAGHTPEALQPFNDNMIIKIKDEVVYQQKVLKRFKKDIKASELAHYDVVKTLIRELTNRKKQLDNFRKLEELGDEAVPAIIYLMDDFRRLPIKHISLTCPPGWFEGLRHYSPDRVVDALAAILNQITGKSFGTMIYNGDDSRKEKQRTIHGWRIYLHYQRLQEKQKTEEDNS